MELEHIDPQTFTIVSNERDILCDLFTYLDYFGERSVKRMTRSNEIPSGDMQRLCKLMGVETPQKDDWHSFRMHWVDFIGHLALRLKLVTYDIKGTYRGYSSSEPSFIDNYIVVNQAPLQKFLELTPMAQEKHILETLIHPSMRQEYDNYSNNEFYERSVPGRLDAFSIRGSATGIMPMLDFPQVRGFLLDLLKDCPVGQWFSTNALIAYLKTNHRYFIIPEKLPAARNKWETISARYSNFYEGMDEWRHDEKPIPDSAPDAFERVEGRYVERFLENIPLLMQFVDVAYDPKPYAGPLPSTGTLKAFRITERFQRVMNGQESAPRVTVQPNFDVVIEADTYPAAIIRQVSALGEQASSPQSGHGAYVGIYLLQKARVAAAQVKDPKLDVIQLLKKLSGRKLPQNVQVELEEWAGHADQFTLYEGFALLEMAELPPEAEKFSVERIAPNMHLVRNPEKVFAVLETRGDAPIRIQHQGVKFTQVAEAAQSVFPKEKAAVETQKAAIWVKLTRVITISYQFPQAEAFDAIQKVLASLRCPFQSDLVTKTVSIQQKEQEKFNEAVEKLADEFKFEIE